MTNNDDKLKYDFASLEQLMELTPRDIMIYWGLAHVVDEKSLMFMASPTVIKKALFAGSDKVTTKVIRDGLRTLVEHKLVEILKEPNTDLEFIRLVEPKKTFAHTVKLNGLKTISLDESEVLKSAEQKSKILRGPIPEFAFYKNYLAQVSQPLQYSWLELYKDVEWLKAQIMAAQAWELANPSRTKKDKGKFLNNWFANSKGKFERNAPARPVGRRVVDVSRD